MSARTLQDLWLSSSLLLPIVSLTQDWIGGVHLNFGMTKDPQPGSGKYDPHTFCSGHACTAVISLFYRMLSMFLSLKIGQAARGHVTYVDSEIQHVTKNRFFGLAMKFCLMAYQPALFEI